MVIGLKTSRHILSQPSQSESKTAIIEVFLHVILGSQSWLARMCLTVSIPFVILTALALVFLVFVDI